MSDWTDYQLKRLVELRAQNVPFSRIGEIIGKTKDACIGMLHRCVAASDKLEVDE